MERDKLVFATPSAGARRADNQAAIYSLHDLPIKMTRTGELLFPRGIADRLFRQWSSWASSHRAETPFVPAWFEWQYSVRCIGPRGTRAM